MRATIIQEQEVQTVGKGRCEGIDKDWEGLRIQTRLFQKEPLTGGRGHRPTGVAPLEARRRRTAGVHTASGAAPSTDCQ